MRNICSTSIIFYYFLLDPIYLGRDVGREGKTLHGKEEMKETPCLPDLSYHAGRPLGVEEGKTSDNKRDQRFPYIQRGCWRTALQLMTGTRTIIAYTVKEVSGTEDRIQ